ncbi:MAG TPA: glycosyltransferase family 39 protein [Blastocatellia bacterium]|nr:glycosyltransferase family 39 protein [Blastocatellia bacterium]
MADLNPDFPSGLLVFALLAVLGSLALFATRQHKQTLRFQLKIFLCAFALRFSLSVLIYQFGLVRVLGDEDAIGWWAGVFHYRDWTRQGVGLVDLPTLLMGAFKGNHQGYGYLLGSLFYLTDTPARLPAAAFNGLFGAFTVVLAYRVARTLFSPWVAVRVGWLTCLFPSMIIWSAQTTKEPVIIFLETAALYGCVQLKQKGFSPRHIALCALAIVLAIPFRFYAAYIAGAAIALTLILPQFKRGRSRAASAVGIAALAIPIVILTGVLAQSETEFERFDIQRIQSFRRDVAASAGSGYVSSYDMRTPGGFGVATAVGAAHLLLAPFPWEMGGASLRMALTAPELLIWWWLFFVGVVPGIRYAVKKRFGDVLPLLFFLLGLGLLYSMMFGNIGLVFRQRAQLLPWLFIFAAVGLEQRMLRRKAARKTLTASLLHGRAPVVVTRENLSRPVGPGNLSSTTES